jgi:hypothetical protein
MLFLQLDAAVADDTATAKASRKQTWLLPMLVIIQMMLLYTIQAAVTADLANAAVISCCSLNAAVATAAVLPTERKLFSPFLSESSPVSHTERRLRGEGGKVVHQIVLGSAPAGRIGVEGG